MGIGILESRLHQRLQLRLGQLRAEKDGGSPPRRRLKETAGHNSESKIAYYLVDTADICNSLFCRFEGK